MPTFKAKSEVMDFLRQLIGEVADDPAAVRGVQAIEPGEGLQDYLGGKFLLDHKVQQKNLPPAGTGYALVSPERVINSRYGNLAEANADRLANNPWQADNRSAEPYLPVFLQPGKQVHGANAAYLMPRNPYAGHPIPTVGVMQAATDSDMPLLRVLIHEMRHATSRPEVIAMRPSRSLVLAHTPSVPQNVMMASNKKRKFKSYLSEPAEQISYLGEAKDDYVNAAGKLPATEGDAYDALRLMATGGKHTIPHPTSNFYLEAFQNSPTARNQIKEMMTRVMGVPGIVAAMSAGDE